MYVLRCLLKPFVCFLIRFKVTKKNFETEDFVPNITKLLLNGKLRIAKLIDKTDFKTVCDWEGFVIKKFESIN